MKQTFKIKFNHLRENGEFVKVYGNYKVLPNGLFEFEYYIPKKYELSYIIGNHCYRKDMCSYYAFYSTAKVYKVVSLGKNIKNRKGDFVKYKPNVTNLVVIHAVPSEVCSDSIDEYSFYPHDAAERLFDTFCKIY